jgi:hypothetical protein
MDGSEPDITRVYLGHVILDLERRSMCIYHVMCIEMPVL